MIHRLCMLALLLCTAGCLATVKHGPATDGGSGIRYYRAAPYLLVYSDSKGGLQWQVLYLPDQSRPMMAEPIVIGGRSEMTFEFRNGILAGSTAVGDTTEVPKAILAAVQAALPLIAGALEAPTTAPQVTVPAPYLYKILVRGSTVEFVGGQGDVDISVLVTAENSK